MAKIVALAFDLSDPDQLGEYFCALIRRNKVSLDDVAQGVQLSKGLVSSALNGKKQSRRLILALAGYFGENPDIFFSTEKENAMRKP